METKKLQFENLPAENLPDLSKGMQLNLNGSDVFRYKETIFIPLPRALWRSAGNCACPDCQGKEGFWDTLAVAASPGKPSAPDYAWTVHCPPSAIRRMVELKFAAERKRK